MSYTGGLLVSQQQRTERILQISFIFTATSALRLVLDNYSLAKSETINRESHYFPRFPTEHPFASFAWKSPSSTVNQRFLISPGDSISGEMDGVRKGERWRKFGKCQPRVIINCNHGFSIPVVFWIKRDCPYTSLRHLSRTHLTIYDPRVDLAIPRIRPLRIMAESGKSTTMQVSLPSAYLCEQNTAPRLCTMPLW